MTPAEAGVRVMAFGLGKLTNFPNKIERLRENRELSGPPGCGGPPAISY